MEIRADPKGLRKLVTRAGIEIYSSNGRLYARKWPKKRGPSKDPIQRAYAKKFGQVRRLLKKAPADQQVLARNGVVSTGLYPQDILHTAMTSGWYDLLTPDGDYIGPTPTRLERLVFQGAQIISETGWNAPTGFNTVIAWDEPVMNFPVFWNAMEPARLTVPDGVTEVQIGAFMRTDGPLDGQIVGYIRRNGADFLAGNSSGFDNFHYLSFSTGPLHVAAGDYFECRLRVSSSVGISAAPLNAFWAQVLGTV